jgi:hypothetical protein
VTADVVRNYQTQRGYSLSPDVGRCGVTPSKGLACHTWRDVLLAHSLLRAGVGTVDLMLGQTNNLDANPEVAMALTEASHATHRALVKIGEAMEMLADLSEEHLRQRQMSEDSRAEALNRLEAS